MDAVKGTADLSTLFKAVASAGLVKTLKGDGSFTVFAPNDVAFGKLPDGVLVDLLKPKNVENLKALILRHVVPQTLMAKDISGEKTYKTAGEKEEEIKITKDGKKVTITFLEVNANVILPDTTASNGVVHIIDKVLNEN